MYFLLILILIKGFSFFITFGNQNAKLRIEFYIDLIDDDSGTLMENFIQAVEKSCLQVIESSIIFIKIYPVCKEKYSPLSNYLNLLERISLSFDECHSCSFKKFVKMSNYFRLINKHAKDLVNLDKQKLFDQILQIFNNNDEESLSFTLKNKIFQPQYFSDITSYNRIGLNYPIVYINSVHIDEALKYTEFMWSEIFRVNSSEKIIKCEAYEEYINRLKYY